MGIDLRESSPRLGLFGAEPWSDAMRASIEARLGLKAVDLYGLSEIIGPGVACECAERQAGLHGWEDHFLFEVIDPKTCAPLPIGAAGELVITTLSKEALPMIRYRTRDITRLDDTPCACGRTHLRILRVTGRDDDMLIIRGVNVYPSQVEAALIGLPGVAPHYQIVLSREGPLDAMTIEVEAAPGAALGEAGAAPSAGVAADPVKTLQQAKRMRIGEQRARRVLGLGLLGRGCCSCCRTGVPAVRRACRISGSGDLRRRGSRPSRTSAPAER